MLAGIIDVILVSLFSSLLINSTKEFETFDPQLILFPTSYAWGIVDL